METLCCPDCNKAVSKCNMQLHRLRCRPHHSVSANSRSSSHVSSEWDCQKCSFRNPENVQLCQMCGEGNIWTCNRCGVVNDIVNDLCRHCGNHSSQVGITGWDCERCSYTNPSCVDRCAMCNTSSSRAPEVVPPPGADGTSWEQSEDRGISRVGAFLLAGAVGGAALSTLLSPPLPSPPDTPTERHRHIEASSTRNNRRGGNALSRLENTPTASAPAPLSVLGGAAAGAGFALLAEALTRGGETELFSQPLSPSVRQDR